MNPVFVILMLVAAVGCKKEANTESIPTVRNPAIMPSTNSIRPLATTTNAANTNISPAEVSAASTNQVSVANTNTVKQPTTPIRPLSQEEQVYFGTNVLTAIKREGPMWGFNIGNCSAGTIETNNVSGFNTYDCYATNSAGLKHVITAGSMNGYAKAIKISVDYNILSASRSRANNAPDSPNDVKRHIANLFGISYLSVVGEACTQTNVWEYGNNGKYFKAASYYMDNTLLLTDRPHAWATLKNIEAIYRVDGTNVMIVSVLRKPK